MEILITISKILTTGFLIIFSIWLAKEKKTKEKSSFYTLFNLVVLGLFIIFLAWWNFKSNLLLLKHYGYNIDGMNANEFYANVSSENLEKVKKLETNIMGIGWPLQAIFGYIIFSPYFIFIIFRKSFTRKLNLKKTRPNT